MEWAELTALPLEPLDVDDSYEAMGFVLIVTEDFSDRDCGYCARHSNTGSTRVRWAHTASRFAPAKRSNSPGGQCSW